MVTKKRSKKRQSTSKPRYTPPPPPVEEKSTLIKEEKETLGPPTVSHGPFGVADSYKEEDPSLKLLEGENKKLGKQVDELQNQIVKLNNEILRKQNEIDKIPSIVASKTRIAVEKAKHSFSVIGVPVGNFSELKHVSVDPDILMTQSKSLQGFTPYQLEAVIRKLSEGQAKIALATILEGKSLYYAIAYSKMFIGSVKFDIA